MIHVSDIAEKLQKFLQLKGEKKFKIFVRVNFSIEVWIVSDDDKIGQKYREDFIDYLLRIDSDLDDFYAQNKESLRLTFKVISIYDAENDDLYSSVFKEGYEVIDRGPRYRFDSLLNRKRELPQKDNHRAPMVTFYSYKGGMGRTTTMVSYAMSLAMNDATHKKKRVVIIDGDLEAPGYLNFFDLSEHNGLRSGKRNGFVEFLSDAQLIKDPTKLDINDYIINVGIDNKNSFAYNNLDTIWLVPAGNLNEGYLDVDAQIDIDRNDYLEGLGKVNLGNVNVVIKYFNLLLDRINDVIKPDIILFDSRTGFNDIFGTAAFYLSEYVVGFFGFSRQTQPGLINLLNEYYKPENKFKLQLVFSILPEDADESWINGHKREVESYIKYIEENDTTKDYPSFLYLHRNSVLERIGTGDDQADLEFVNIIKNKKNSDYNLLFSRINSFFFNKQEISSFTKDTPSIQLRNVVLKHLKEALENVSNFAEDTEISEKQFFYRECMKELFDPKKFIIQGYKGTGKTYLYKALADDDIAQDIQEWAGIKESSTLDPIFVNILPTSETALVFNGIYYSGINEPEFYFDAFWQIYTWNAIFLSPVFENNPEVQKIKEESALKEFILPLTGSTYAKQALVRINKLIDKGIETLISVEQDIEKLNSYLKSQNKQLFVLYDRLDTCINPLRWNKAVSPLINYWRNNCLSYSNIAPKIFVRTDLFKQIEGTNTARLENSIIHIEWTIGEVFGFFFKLIFSDKTAADAYWTIADKVGIDKAYIKNTKTSFRRFPEDQFKSLQEAAMSPIIRVFFGNDVRVSNDTRSLGSPWDYFENELANADNTSISLRPFINTLNSNAVDKALERTVKYIKNGIIPPEIYASKAVRDDTTEKYFADLTQDAFSKDLLRFKEVIRSAGGEPFRFKSLTETLFEDLISKTFERITESEVVKSKEDLKSLIFANGIMAEKVTNKGRYFRFAPIYWYSWGLVNSVIERQQPIARRHEELLQDGVQYTGKIVERRNSNGMLTQKISCPNFPYDLTIKDGFNDRFYDGDMVTFIAHSETNWRDPSKVFWSATDLKSVE